MGQALYFGRGISLGGFSNTQMCVDEVRFSADLFPDIPLHPAQRCVGKSKAQAHPLLPCPELNA